MITPVLKLIKEELNAFITPQFPKHTPEVVVGKLTTSDGRSTVPKEVNRVVITLLNIQEERNVHQSRTSNPHGLYHFNLTLLFSTHEREQNQSGDHLNSLQYLDAVMHFFQQNPVITPQQNPRLPAEVPHLHFHLISEGLRETSYIWTMTGAKHVPSVLFMVRSAVVGNNLVNNVSML